MPQAHADPDELEEFAVQLGSYLEEVDSLTCILQQRFAGLSDTWQDQEQQRFADEFDQLTSTLRRFNAAVEPLIPHLRAKASHLRDYLSP
ncbi:MAG TPA: hypothetical protein DDZ51_26355 [Planctomycetaceae bacterium]|nr:hypothetical protein [Planctomycetaceae bacterium]